MLLWLLPLDSGIGQQQIVHLLSAKSRSWFNNHNLLRIFTTVGRYFYQNDNGMSCGKRYTCSHVIANSGAWYVHIYYLDPLAMGPFFHKQFHKKSLEGKCSLSGPTAGIARHFTKVVCNVCCMCTFK